MKKLLFLSAVSGLLMLNACERSSDASVTTSDYYQLTPGNYWVYQVQEILNDTSVTTLASNDSIFVEKDTLINSFMYSKITGIDWRQKAYRYYLRDSTGFLVDQNGIINFSADNWRDTLYMRTDAFANVVYKMDEADSAVSVPVGSFNCRFYRGTATSFSQFQFNTTMTCGDFRAAGVGLVKSSVVTIGNNFRRTKNLIRYHIGDTK